MLRAFAILIFATAIFTALVGQSMARVTAAHADGRPSALTSTSHDLVISDGDGCPDCLQPHGRCCCPGCMCHCPSCATAFAILAYSSTIPVFAHASAVMRPEEDEVGSNVFGLDPPVPRPSK